MKKVLSLSAGMIILLAPHYPHIIFDAYLYDSGGTLLDARSEKR